MASSSPTSHHALLPSSSSYFSIFHNFIRGTGLPTVIHSARDIKLILLSRFIRIFAFGLVSLLLAAYLSALGYSETRIGLFFFLTLLGGLVIVMVLTQIADGVGRKNVLMCGAGGMVVSGVVFAAVPPEMGGSYWVLLGAAVVGVLSPSATEVGPFKSVEESALFTLLSPTPHHLVDILSWYGTAEFSSIAVGLAASGGIMSFLVGSRDWKFVDACRVVFGIYAAVGIVKGCLAGALSERVESWAEGKEVETGVARREEDEGGIEEEDAETEALLPSPNVAKVVDDPSLLSSTAMTTATRKATRFNFRQTISRGLLNSVFTLNRTERILLLQLCALMGTDASAVGMSSVPWQTYFVRTTFAISDGPLGLIFFFSNILGACGTISSNALARRMGNLVTVAVTYTPAALLIALYGFVPHNHLSILIPIILLQAFFEPIYIAPRNAFIGRVINREKRTAIFGVINMVKIVSNATGSFLTGFCADWNRFWLAFVVAGALKLVYIAALLWTFLGQDRRLEREVRVARENMQRQRQPEESLDSGDTDDN